MLKQTEKNMVLKHIQLGLTFKWKGVFLLKIIHVMFFPTEVQI